MVHSIELLFDPHTEESIRRIWAQLADAGLPSQATVASPTNRPHVTLAVADRIGGEVDALLVDMSRRLPLRCEVGAPLLFGRSRPVLARLIVPSTDLLSVHAQVSELCLPHMVPGPAPHTTPGQWTPHTTLARRVDPAQLAEVLKVPGVLGDITGSIAGLRRWDGDARVDYPIS
jgi:hypothetical protein